MPRSLPPVAGLVWCAIFVVLDAVQAVYFGAVLQRLDSFLIGGLVFGLSAAGCLIWAALRDPGQIGIAFAHRGALMGLNASTAGAWVTYLIAVQLVEPAVAFALFCGLVPLTMIVAGWLGSGEGQAPRNRLEAAGNLVLAGGLALLCGVTLMGWSGFVRGGSGAALAGLALAIAGGVLISMMLMYSKRLDRHGRKPIAQYGFRFPLYLVLTLAGWGMGLDAKGPAMVGDVLMAVAIGLLLLAFPIYAVQKAVSLTTGLTIGAFAATAPLIVFLLQMIEGRVDYSEATWIGLLIYFAGAILAGIGGARSVIKPKPA